MKLHELKDFEHIFKLEHPGLFSVLSEQYSNAVRLTSLFYRSMEDLIDVLETEDANLCYKRLVVLQNVDRQIFTCSVAAFAPLSDSELKTG